MLQNVTIDYVANTDDLQRARRELGLLGNAEHDLLEEFRKVNAEAAKQTKILEDIRDKGKQATDALDTGTKKASGSMGVLGKTAKLAGGLIAGAFAVDQLINFANQIFKTTAAYQKFKAVLTNTLGSQKAAADAMNMIATFAAKTPFGVQELTGAFVKLANMGLKPTQEQMRQLGDLASSTGKSFDQLSEAILDAGAFEFERLKEFGVRAKKSGDEITFTFKGVETTVKATSAAVQNYIMGLGDLQGVSGSMAAISGTLEGQSSNLGDSMDRLFLIIGNGTAGPMSDALSMANNFVNSLADMIEGADALQKSNVEQLRSATSVVNKNRELADTYTKLSGKTKLTKEEKQQLSRVSSELIGIYGQSITRINEETGALEINAAALMQKIQLEVALQSEAAKKLIADKLRLETQIRLAEEAEARLEALQASVVGENVFATAYAGQINALVAAAKVGSTELIKVTQQQRAAFLNGGQDAAAYNKQVEAILPTLNQIAGAVTLEAGNKAKLKEIEAELLASGLDLNALAVDRAKVTTEAATEELGLIGRLEKAIKNLNEEKKKTNSRERIAAINDEVAALQKQLDALNALSKAQAGGITAPKPSGVVELGKKELKDLDADKLRAKQELEAEFALIEIEGARNRAAKAREIEEAKKEYMIQAGQDVFYASVGFIDALFERQSQRLAEKQQQLADDKDYELSLAGDTAGAKEKIERVYADKEAAIRKEQAELQRKQAIFNKAVAIMQIGVNTALGISKVIAEVPKVDFGITTGILIAAYAAMGALQAASVVAAPVPKYAKGTRNVTGGEAGKDSVLAYLMPGEGVMPTDINREYNAALTAIYERKIPAAMINGYARNFKEMKAPAAWKIEAAQAKEESQLNEALLQAISERPVHQTVFDDRGVSRWVVTKAGRQRDLNNRHTL